MRNTLFLLSLILSWTAVQAGNKIVSGKKYRIECQASLGGSIVLGHNHGAYAYLWNYDSDGMTHVPDDGWWIFTEAATGEYTIRNAQSNEYMVYIEGRPQDAFGHYLAKGIQLSSSANDAKARWKFAPANGNFFIVENVGTAGQYFHLRKDGTELLGTYGSAGGTKGYFSLYDEAGNQVSDVSDTPDGSQVFSAYVDSLRLGGRDLVYDAQANKLYATLPESVRGGNDYEAPLYVKFHASAPEGMTVKIDGADVPEDDMLRFPSVSCAEPYKVTLCDKEGTVVEQSDLCFTFLPIVEVYVQGCNGSTYTRGQIRVSDAEVDTVHTGFASFRYRGASSQSYDKKNYAVKLCDSKGNSVDKEFFGLRNDNNWILDAMAIDKACMRNRVSTDLWNDYAAKPYQWRERWESKARSGTRGRFVEVFLNGTYHGLYCMTEKMDRKQLKLKKYETGSNGTGTIHGVLYKTVSWGQEVEMVSGHTPAAYNNDKRSESWNGYEIKYPDWETERIDWGPLWNAINFASNSSNRDFADHIGEWFDLPSLLDYRLLLELSHAHDNAGKNLYYYIYDIQHETYGKTLGVAVWDLDCSWGRNWNGSDLYDNCRQAFANYNKLQLLTRLEYNYYMDWHDQLSERYAQLRQDVFTVESLVKRFEDYRDLFVESGANLREQDRWNKYHTNLAGDVDDIAKWIEQRLDYMDGQHGYDPTTNSIDHASSASRNVIVRGGKGCISFLTSSPCKVEIHTIDGALVRILQLEDSESRTEPFQPGMYIVAGKKVVVGK